MEKINSNVNANSQGMDSSEIVVSSIRPGMKREFTMMMKAQVELGGLTAGRRRVTRSQYASSSSMSRMAGDGRAGKKDDKKEKLGGVVAELVGDKTDLEKVREDISGGAVQPLCTETLSAQVGGSDKVIREGNVALEGGKLSQGSDEAGTSTARPLKLEMKMSKKVELKRIPTRLKDLLETGLLEGLLVRYCGSKGKRRPGSVLHGTIQGKGILCSCDECKGNKVVTPNQFELHAHSGNKRPPQYIFLDNGNSLRDVLDACKVDHLDSLQSVIQSAVGRTDYTDAYCLECKGLIPEAGAGRHMLLCDSCIPPKDPDSVHAQTTDTAPSCQPALPESVETSSPIPSSCQASVLERANTSSPIPSSCQPAIIESAETSDGGQQAKRQGRITLKDLRMHKSIWSADVLPDGSVLRYVSRGRVMLEGHKMGTSIYCLCCQRVISPSVFEAHAGFASRRKPYMNIYTAFGKTLHALAIEVARQRDSDIRHSDDSCLICQDGGELLCCDNCPRAFHIGCVRLPNIPEGRWYCKYCRHMFAKVKNQELDANAIAAMRVSGVDPMADINQRCIRIMETFEDDVGGCAICRLHDFSDEGFDDRTVILCDQCEKEYHVGCLKEKNIANLEELPKDGWFCHSECSYIHSALLQLIAAGEQQLPEPIVDKLKKKLEVQGSQQNCELNIRWRLLRGREAWKDQTRVWLAGAVSILHEQFDPIADESTDNVDLIPHMVYGRKVEDHYDFFGMYTAVLLVNSEIASVGVFRVFGEDVAELPLVATAANSQGKGCFKALYDCIEDLLSSLKVKDLVLPASHDAERMWKTKFGFTELKEKEISLYKKKYQNVMVFQGTSMLHKPVPQKHA